MASLSSSPMRERAALVLLGYTGLVLLISFVLLFPGESEFPDKASQMSSAFVSPVLIGLLVGVVALVSYGEPTGWARPLTLSALGLLAVMAALAVLCWLAGLAVDTGPFERPTGLGGLPRAGKVSGTFLMLIGIALLGAAIWFVLTRLRALPAPEPRPSKQPSQQPSQQYRPSSTPRRSTRPRSTPSPAPYAPPPYAPPQYSPAGARTVGCTDLGS